MNRPTTPSFHGDQPVVAVDEASLASVLAAGRNSMLLLVSRAVNMLSQLGLVLIISRLLGQEGLGAFSFILSTTILASCIATFGLDTLITREAARNPGQGPKLVANLLGLKLVCSAAAFLIVNLVFLFTPLQAGIQRQLLIYSLSLFFSSLSTLLWFYGDALDHFKLHGLLWATTHIFRTGLAGAVLLLGGSLTLAFGSLVAAEAAALAVSWMAISRAVHRLEFRFEWGIWKAALKDAWIIAVYMLLGAVAFRIDVVILLVLRGAEEVGIYSAAFKFVEMMHVLPSSLSLVYFPRFTRSHACGGSATTTRFLLRLLPAALGMGLLLGAMLYVASPWIIGLLYGPAFAGSVVALRILVFKIILMFVNFPLSYALLSMGDERRTTAWAASATALNVVANLILVPAYGSSGAALASVLSEAVLLVAWGGCLLNMK